MLYTFVSYKGKKDWPPQ